MSERYGFKTKLAAMLGNAALIALGVGAALIVAELALRLILPNDLRQPFEFRIPHPILGWALQPDVTYLYAAPDGTVSVTYNSQGWRDLERSVAKPEGVFRILVLGDSFMEANAVPLDDAFHRQLEVMARAAGRKIEVINLGVAGYGTLQEYLAFREYGRLYAPDLVLLAFYDANDLMNNSVELASSLTEVGRQTDTRPFLDTSGPGGWRITPVDFEGAQRDYSASVEALTIERNKLAEKAMLVRLAGTGIEAISVPEFLRDWTGSAAPINHEVRELAVLGVNYCDEPAAYTRSWDITEQILSQLNREVEALGSQLVVFMAPSLETVSVDYMNEVADGVANPEKLCLEAAPGHSRLKAILQQLNVEMIPLLEDFRGVVRQDGAQLYGKDLHWNREGHALAAERMLSELIRRGLLPVAGSPVMSLP
jgi:hypothetical protein